MIDLDAGWDRPLGCMVYGFNVLYYSNDYNLPSTSPKVALNVKLNSIERNHQAPTEGLARER